MKEEKSCVANIFVSLSWCPLKMPITSQSNGQYLISFCSSNCNYWELKLIFLILTSEDPVWACCHIVWSGINHKGIWSTIAAVLKSTAGSIRSNSIPYLVTVCVLPLVCKGGQFGSSPQLLYLLHYLDFELLQVLLSIPLGYASIRVCCKCFQHTYRQIETERIGIIGLTF